MSDRRDDASPREPVGSLRRVQWAQIAIYAVISLALVGTALHNLRSVRGAARTVAHGIGERLLHAVRQAAPPGGLPSQSDLDFVVEARDAQGLRCIVLFGPDGRPSMRAGTCTLDDARLASARATMRPSQLVQIGDRFTMVHQPPHRGPGRRGRRRPPPGPPPDARHADGPKHPPPGHPPHEWSSEPPDDGRGDGRGRGDRQPGPEHRPPHSRHSRGFLIEFEPLQAQALLVAVTRSAAVAGVATLALLAGGIVLWRLSRRAEALQAAAERDRQLVSLGTMSAVLAHEIRNPLASLKGHAQLLAETLETPGKEHDKAARIVHEAQRLERLTHDLLSLTGAGKIAPGDVNPAELLREAAASLDLDRRVELHTNGAPPTWRLDGSRMHQVLTNLMRNAADASPNGHTAHAAVALDRGKLVFTIRDHGPGIAAGDEERIFEPFYTTRVRGTGLGLAVSRRIVDLHGGSLTARSHPGGGAEFRVVLP